MQDFLTDKSNESYSLRSKRMKHSYSATHWTLKKEQHSLTSSKTPKSVSSLNTVKSSETRHALGISAANCACSFTVTGNGHCDTYSLSNTDQLYHSFSIPVLDRKQTPCDTHTFNSPLETEL